LDAAARSAWSYRAPSFSAAIGVATPLDAFRMNPVLYAEDDENDAFLMEYSFRKEGVTRPLRILSDGAQAIAYLAGEPPFSDRETFPLPHVLLLDLNMPQRSGFEVLRWARSRPELQALPIVIFSSSNHQRDAMAALDFGANAYHVKPANVAQLAELVRAWRESWLRDD
jgi:CheY-like chemotaxis protein